jgi:hypothetical protein
MNLAFQNSDQLRAVLAHLNIPAQANKADLINQVLLALEQGLITKQEIKKIFETAVPSPVGLMARCVSRSLTPIQKCMPPCKMS